MDQKNINKILEIMRAKNTLKKTTAREPILTSKEDNKQDLNILEIIISFMELAEGIKNYTGAQKKAFVVEKVNEYAQKMGVFLEQNQVSQYIEDLIRLTKKVNA